MAYPRHRHRPFDLTFEVITEETQPTYQVEPTLTPVLHWMSPTGVTCLNSLGEKVIQSTTDTEKVTCSQCLFSVGNDKLPEPCSRCKGAGYDPENHANDPTTGAPEPVACWDCNGSGEESGGQVYEDDDGYNF